MNEIKYWIPIQHAWNKMMDVLFRPFDIGKWMVIGFTAFLANCGRGNGGNSNFNSGSSHRSSGSGQCDIEDTDWFQEVIYFFKDAWAEHAALIVFSACALVVLIIGITVLVNWLNGRGQFMFLDNVLKNRGAVKLPWHEYRKEGNSLMVFQIVVDAVWTLILFGFVAGVIVMLCSTNGGGASVALTVISIILLVVVLIAVCVVYGFIKMVLSHFIVPLMYKHRLSVREALAVFDPVFRQHFWRIVLFGLVMLVVSGAIGVATVLGVLLTCCTALILLIIPYIGTVVLLPVYVFVRFIGVEFLKQFGDEYDLIKDCSISTRKLEEKVEDDPQSW